MPRRRPVPGGQEAQKGTLEALGATGRPEHVFAAIQRAAAPQKQRKYRNVPAEADGYRFDSTKERDRYFVLKTLAERGEIHSLEIHPRFPLVIHGIDTGDYVADFRYITRDGESVVEDVKSPSTRKLAVYRLKRLQLWALYAIEIREIT